MSVKLKNNRGDKVLNTNQRGPCYNTYYGEEETGKPQVLTLSPCGLTLNFVEETMFNKHNYSTICFKVIHEYFPCTPSFIKYFVYANILKL